MEAVILTGGKQYRVAEGDRIVIEKLEGRGGEQITFDKVLMLLGEKTTIGTPYVSGAQVMGQILDQDKTKKVVVYKYKRRKGYHKKQGHRQNITRIEIKEINGSCEWHL